MSDLDICEVREERTLTKAARFGPFPSLVSRLLCRCIVRMVIGGRDGPTSLLSRPQSLVWRGSTAMRFSRFRHLGCQAGLGKERNAFECRGARVFIYKGGGCRPRLTLSFQMIQAGWSRCSHEDSCCELGAAALACRSCLALGKV